MTDLMIKRSAEFSADRRWRWRLERDMGIEGKTATICMANPSVADSDVDDPTIRRVMGLGTRIGITRWIIVNMHALVSTDIKGLAEVDDPVGEFNDQAIARAFSEADICIAGWGAIGKFPKQHRERWRDIVWLAAAAGRTLQCWAVNADGHPKHPLYLRNDSVLFDWVPPS